MGQKMTVSLCGPEQEGDRRENKPGSKERKWQEAQWYDVHLPLPRPSPVEISTLDRTQGTFTHQRSITIE